MPAPMRTFESGATRDGNEDKPDHTGYLSPLAIQRYGEYMLKHEVQSDGTRRGADNWKRGIPVEQYLASAFRHLLDWWLEADGHESRDGLEDALCGLLFNVQGALHEVMTGRDHEDIWARP